MKKYSLILGFSFGLLFAQSATTPQPTETTLSDASESIPAVDEVPLETTEDNTETSLESSSVAKETNSFKAEAQEVSEEASIDSEDAEIDSVTAKIRSQINYSPIDEANEDTPVSSDEFFMTSVGTSIHNYSIEGGAQFGMYNHILNWFASFSVILWKGEAEINIPITYYFSDLELEDGFSNPDHRMFSIALKYRKWHQNEDIGIFYGMGMRLTHWSLKYDRQYLTSSAPQEPDPFFVFIPQAEFGYQYAMNRDFAVRSSLEFGYALSAYNDLMQADNITNIEYQDNTIYWNLLVGLVYSF